MARGSALLSVILLAYAYWVRPSFPELVSGQPNALVWVSWYTTAPVLAIAAAGLAVFLWSEARGGKLLGVILPCVVAAPFLHHTFARNIHIYLTRRYVAATIPLVFLFFGYAMARIGATRLPRVGTLAVATAAAFVAAAGAAVVERSLHLYPHREYAGLTAELRALAASVEGADVVLLVDHQARNLLGAALEVVFDVPAIVAAGEDPAALDFAVRSWVAGGRRVDALAVGFREPERLPAREEFELVEETSIRLRTLAEVRDRFPRRFLDVRLPVVRYAAGADDDPAYRRWKARGDRLAAEVCPVEVRLVGGSRDLVRRLTRRCALAGAPQRSAAVLAETEEAAAWRDWLDAFGARYVPNAIGDAILFLDVAPRRRASHGRLLPAGFAVTASSGRGGERLALDGDPATRWASRAPQAAGMSFTVEFPEPVDVSRVRVRSGRFPHDRARALAWETSIDGERWERRDVPLERGAIRWRDDASPEVNAGV
ncbi:MAG: discoidin domain-containing protein, partial [Candidatus Binatia bacterium]